MLKNECCLYVIITIRLFSITICKLLIDLLSYVDRRLHFMFNPIVCTCIYPTKFTDLKLGGVQSIKSMDVGQDS